MKRRDFLGLLPAATFLSTGACSRQKAESGPRPADSTLHTIAFAGDTMLARSVNTLVTDRGLDKPLAGVREQLSTADLCVLNLECVISARGLQSHLEIREKAYLRGRPEMIGALTGAGVDVVSLANNHGEDYGPVALADSVELLEAAGIGAAGVGTSAEAAGAAVFRQLGDIVVAFVGAHMKQPSLDTSEGRARTNYLGRKQDAVVEQVKAQVEAAREHAHLVFLMIHWGPNGRDKPAKSHRKLAKRFVREAGIDGLLGTSAHLVQGIESVDGRPIIYDAGNLLLDFPDRGRWSHKSAIFTLHADAWGVAKIELTPLRLYHGYTELAQGERAAQTLERIAELSADLGTAIEVSEGAAVVEFSRTDKSPDPRSAWAGTQPEPEQIRVPQSGGPVPGVIVDALPPSATPLSVRFEGGIELLGFELAKEAPLVMGLNLRTYWRTEVELDTSYEVFIDIEDPKGRRKRNHRWREVLHQPGDWMYPTTWWKPGEIVVDLYHTSRSGKLKVPEDCDIYVGLTRGEQRLKVLPQPESDPVAAPTEGGEASEKDTTSEALERVRLARFRVLPDSDE